MSEDFVVVIVSTELSRQTLDATEGVEDIGTQGEVPKAEAIV